MKAALSLDCVQAPRGASKPLSVTDALSLWALPDALLTPSVLTGRVCVFMWGEVGVGGTYKLASVEDSDEMKDGDN